MPQLLEPYPNTTARPYGLPARLELSTNMILRHARKPAQGQCLVFTRRWTLNPKTLKPQKPLKPWNPENSESESRTHCVYAVFSAISLLMFDDRESSMLQSGQTTGSARNARWIYDISWLHLSFNHLLKINRFMVQSVSGLNQHLGFCLNI